MDYQLEYLFDESNCRWDITLSGEVDIFNSAKLKSQLISLLDEKEADIYLHCKHLEFIDSTALGALVGVMKTAKSKQREIHLVSLKPSVMKLFRITNLDTVFKMEETEDA